MTNSFIGQVGDVTNHKQDFESYTCVFAFFLPLSLSSVEGNKEGAGDGEQSDMRSNQNLNWEEESKLIKLESIGKKWKRTKEKTEEDRKDDDVYQKR